VNALGRQKLDALLVNIFLFGEVDLLNFYKSLKQMAVIALSSILQLYLKSQRKH
jgi:hypothetical protein